MGSSNIHHYRSSGFMHRDKNNQADMMFGFSKDVFTQRSYGFPSDLTKTDRLGTAKYLQGELIKIDPSDPNCLGVDYRDGANVTTLNNLGSIGGSSTNTVIFPTLQLPKVYREGSSNRFNLYTAPMLNFDNNTLNATSFSFGTTSSLSFIHRVNSNYSMYFVLSLRQNHIASSPNSGTPTGIDDIILSTSNNTGGIGFVVRVSSGLSDNSRFNFQFIMQNASGANLFSATIPLQINKLMLHLPIVVSILCTNSSVEGSSMGWMFVNGIRTREIISPGDAFSTNSTSNTAPTFFKRPSTSSSYSGNYLGGIGDIKIFNRRHDEETHQNIVQMLMKKYKIN